MPAPATSSPDQQARALGMWLAALTPLLAMLAANAAFAGCADRDDALIGAALGLSPAATSGYPLASLLAHAFTYLPLGPSVLRIALASSSALAVAAGALYCAIDTSLGLALGAASAHAEPDAPAALVRSPLALALVLFAFGCDALFGTEAHAHGVSVALACLYLERVTAIEASWPRRKPEALRAGAFWLGLLLVEQPALAAMLLLGSLPWLRRVKRVYAMPRVQAIVLGVGGLLAVGLLRLEARSDPARVAAAGTLDVTRAFEFAAHTTPWLERLRGLGFGPSVLFALTLVAFVRFARAPEGQRMLELWLTVAASASLGSSLFAHATALFVLALCAAAASCALLLGKLLGAAERPLLALVISLLAVVLGGAHLRATALRRSAHDERAFDLLRDALSRSLPARTLALVEPDLARTLYDAELEERVRPDVRIAIKPWRLDLAGSEALRRAAPELQPLMRTHLLQAELPAAELQTLAVRRPVLIEHEAEHERALDQALLPYGLYHQVSTSVVSRNDERFAARDAEPRLAKLWDSLRTEWLAACTRRLLLERAQADADYYRQLGDREHAELATARQTALEQPSP